jgi:hypothetical protein
MSLEPFEWRVGLGVVIVRAVMVEAVHIMRNNQFTTTENVTRVMLHSYFYQLHKTSEGAYAMRRLNVPNVHSPVKDNRL